MKHWLSFPKLASYAIIFSLIVIASCSKEKSETGSDSQEEEVSKVSGEADAEAESTFNEFFDDVMGVNNDVGVSGSGVFYGRPDTLTPVPRCFTVTITHPTGNPFPVRIVVDFGTTGCPGPDGRIRRGKIITEYTNRLIVPGAMAVTTFERFFVNDISVEGTHKITNITPVPPVNLGFKYKVEVIAGKLTKPNGDYTEWSSVKTIQQIEGMLTPDMPRDDVFRIEGTANGKTQRGNLLVRWESITTEPLIRRFTCRWIVKGRIKTIRATLPSNSRWVAVLDFGAGNCDNQATLTINGVTRQITLP